MIKLQEFYLDEPMREAVKDFITRYLADKTVERVFGNKDVSGIYEAKTLIEGAFSELEVNFKPKKEKQADTSR